MGLGAIGEGLASGDVGLEGLADLGDFLGEEAVELGLLPVLDGLSLRFVVGRKAVVRALVQEDERRTFFGAVDFGAPFLFGELGGDTQGFGGDLGDGGRIDDFEGRDYRDLGVLGLDPGGEFLAVGLGGIDGELLGELVGDLASEVGDRAVGTDKLLKLSALGEGLFLDLTGLELELLSLIIAHVDDLVVGDRGGVGGRSGNRDGRDGDLRGEAVVLDIGREGFLHLGVVDLDLGFEASGGEGGDVDGPLGAFAVEDTLDLAGGGVAGTGEGADGFLDAPSVLDVVLEAGAGLFVGDVELLGGELQELVEAVGVLAVGGGGHLAGNATDFDDGGGGDAEGVGEAEFGDALDQAVFVHALAGHLGEESRVTEAGADGGVVEVDALVDGGGGLAAPHALDDREEDERNDNNQEQGSEDETVLLCGGVLEPGNHSGNLPQSFGGCQSVQALPGACIWRGY